MHISDIINVSSDQCHYRIKIIQRTSFAVNVILLPKRIERRLSAPRPRENTVKERIE